MTKQLLTLATLICLILNSYSQPANIYQPNGNTTNFGKVAADSLNYYVVNYPALTLMKIDASNAATLVTTLTADPFQTMIWNNGKGIYPVANGSPFKLYDGTSAMDINGGQLPLAGYTGDKVIVNDYFHKGNTTYFRTNDKIYQTDYSSASSIQTLATRIDPSFFGGILEMQHTSNSIFYSESSQNGGFLKRIDLTTGMLTTIDSTGTFDFGTVYNNEYYYCTPNDLIALGTSKVYKVSDNGTKTVLYTESASNKNLLRIIGVTPNGVIAIIATTSTGKEYVSISNGTATPLNFNTVANSLPCGNVGVGSSRTTNSLVYFETLDTLYTVNSNNKALWVTDGTLAGTQKIVGGTPSTFSIDNLSPWIHGSAAHCDNDLYYKGTKGASVDKLIYVNGITYSVQAYPITVNPTTPSIYKTENGIKMIALPLPTSSAEKAVFDVNCSLLSGVEDTLSKQIDFDVFPNPSNGQITINVSENIGNYTVTVHNLVGAVVYSDPISQQTSSINLNLKTGFYFVSLHNKAQKNTKKIIVE